MLSASNHLLLFTRCPQAGLTKTRLIPSLGAEGAAQLQRRLAERLVYETQRLDRSLQIATLIHYAGGDRQKMHDWLGPLTCIPQTGGDLGRRMQAAFAHSFLAGADKVVLVGSDIPDIDAALLTEAFTLLAASPVVLGPCVDGGYYLVGMRAEGAERLFPLLFEHIPWSTPGVFATTRARLVQAGHSPAILPVLRDIDVEEDLPFARSRGLL